MRKRFIVTALLLTIIGVSVFTQFRNGGFKFQNRISCSGSKCNVIFIVVDALGAKHMSLYGYDRKTTPFIDEFFGKEGLVFLNASATGAWTIPSFASLFTSRYPSQVYVETLEDKLSPAIPTFIEPLRRAGINLAIYPQGLFQLRMVKSRDNGNKKIRDFGIIERFKDSEIFRFQDDKLVFLSAGNWIQEHTNSFAKNNKPYFMLLHLMTVHSPYNPPAGYRQLFGAPAEYPGPVTWDDLRIAKERGPTLKEKERFLLQYDQEIRYFDDIFKDFIKSLPPGSLNNTIIILTADHGEAFGEHGRLEHSSTLYEEMIHIPLLIHLPKLNSMVINEPVSLIDLATFILDIYRLPQEKTFQGTSLLSLFKAGGGPRIIRAERIENPTLRDDFEPFIRKESLPRISKGIMVRLGKWKLIRNPDGSLELYNLASDPQESVNLITEWKNLPLAEQAKILQLFSSPELSLEQ